MFVWLLYVLMVLSVVGVWLIVEVDGWCVVYISFGFMLVGVMVLCFIWGLVGSGLVCFMNFLCGLVVVVVYLCELLVGCVGLYVGYNFVGGWVVLVLLGIGLLVVGSGWLVWIGGEVWEEVYEVLVNGLLLLVGVYIVVVFVISWFSCDWFVLVMLIGCKVVLVGMLLIWCMYCGLVMLVFVVVLGLWVWSLGLMLFW